MAPQNDPKTIQKTNQKTTRKKDPKKTQHRRKKPDPAVNGKRRLKTPFVIFNFLVCICSFHLLAKLYEFKHFSKDNKKEVFATLCRSLAALGALLAALGRSWAALGRSWAALGPLLVGSFWGPLHRSWHRSWADLGHFGPPTGPSFSHPKRQRKRNKKQEKKNKKKK